MILTQNTELGLILELIMIDRSPLSLDKYVSRNMT